jgi:hypothetical protein
LEQGEQVTNREERGKPMIDYSGPAFPVPQKLSVINNSECFGMSLRDWFAGMALQGMLSRADCGITSSSRLAYQFADAMLVACSPEAENEK